MSNTTDYTRNNEIHLEALKAWERAHFKGTVEAITGIGKSWIGIRAAIGYSKFKKRKINVLFLSERVNRKKTITEEITKYELVNNISTAFILNIKFALYQSAYKYKGVHADLVICDEIHDSLTPQYCKFYSRNTYDAIIGLSATVDRDTTYYDEEEGTEYTKGDLIDEIAPVMYQYGLAQGQAEGTARELELYVIHTHLDALHAVVKGGSKAKPFMQTEQAAYNFWNGKLRLSMIQNRTDFRAISVRKKIIHQGMEKRAGVKSLIDYFEAKSLKTIIFTKFVDSLEGLCEIISYKKKDAIAKLDDLAKGTILTVANCKMLQQGVSVPDLDICILHSYDSKPKGFIQSVGRLRKDGNKVGTVIVFVTVGTKEEKWFQGMLKGSGLEPIYCTDVLEFENKWENRNKLTKEL